MFGTSKHLVSYQGLTFNVLVDGAGLDIEATDEASLADIKLSSGKSQELFSKIFDLGYERLGLATAIREAGAEIIG